MKPVFADTFYWIALSNPKDDAHRQVLEFSKQPDIGPIVTTDEVLIEFLAYCASDPRLRIEAVALSEDLLHSQSVIVIPQTRRSFLAGLELYRARPDKEYSLTDYISMQTMRRAGLTDALTNDRHFRQERFNALFRKP